MATSSSKSGSSAPGNKLESIQKALHDFLHAPSAVTPLFELVEKNAKLKREYLFLGGFARALPLPVAATLVMADL
jgi:hypothetical protein